MQSEFQLASNKFPESVTALCCNNNRSTMFTWLVIGSMRVSQKSGCEHGSVNVSATNLNSCSRRWRCLKQGYRLTIRLELLAARERERERYLEREPYFVSTARTMWSTSVQSELNEAQSNCGLPVHLNALPAQLSAALSMNRTPRGIV